VEVRLAKPAAKEALSKLEGVADALEVDGAYCCIAEDGAGDVSLVNTWRRRATSW